MDPEPYHWLFCLIPGYGSRNNQSGSLTLLYRFRIQNSGLSKVSRCDVYCAAVLLVFMHLDYTRRKWSWPLLMYLVWMKQDWSNCPVVTRSLVKMFLKMKRLQKFVKSHRFEKTWPENPANIIWTNKQSSAVQVQICSDSRHRANHTRGGVIQNWLIFSLKVLSYSHDSCTPQMCSERG